MIISAEASVKSRRAGFVSILDAQTASITGELQSFYADPLLVREVVEKLKSDGFRVANAGKLTVSFLGPVGLYKRIFGVTLVDTEQGPTCKDVARFGYIDTGKTGYADLLAGIVLTPKVQLNGVPEDPPEPAEGQIVPADLPGMLNFNRTAQTLGKKELISINVVDTGYDRHPYIVKHHPDWANYVTLVEQSDPAVMAELDELAATLDTLSDTVDTLMGYLFKIKPPDLQDVFKMPVANMPVPMQQAFQRTQTSVSAQLTDVFDDETIVEFNAVDTVNGLFNQVTQLQRRVEDMLEEIRDPDPDYHGTAVIITLLELLKGRFGLVYASKFSGDIKPGSEALLAVFQRLASLPQKTLSEYVINCSFSSSQVADNAGEPDGAWYKAYKATVSDLVNKGATVIFTAGNRNSPPPGTRDVEPQWPFVISVGGAFPSTNRSEFVYSPVAHGYRSAIFTDRIVPDVCGVDTPTGTPVLLLPKSREKWKPRTGTSFCAPQVTAACALIKSVWPDANIEEVRRVLIESADEITSGFSAQGNDMSGLKHTLETLQDDDITIITSQKAAGLVNFGKAILQANLNKVRQLSRLEY